MSTPGPELSLPDGFRLSGLSPARLWLAYIAAGGNASELEVEAYACGVLPADDVQHNLVALVINDHFRDRGLNHLVSYRGRPSAGEAAEPP
jgi:hypothetical protein